MLDLIFKWIVGTGKIIIGEGSIKFSVYKKHWGPYSAEFRMDLDEAEQMYKELGQTIENEKKDIISQ